MIVTFCGHSRMFFSDEEKKVLYELLETEIIKNPDCTFYLGEYGAFDNLCYSTLRKLKKIYKNIKLIFISPYQSKATIQTAVYEEDYDEILSAPTSKVPPKFAIIIRNEWMVDCADLVIAYVCFTWGGAYKTLNYAIRKKKKLVNIAKL